MTPPSGVVDPLTPVPPPLSTATCPEHRRQLLSAVATYLHVSLARAGHRVTSVRLPGDALDTVLVLFEYPLEWRTFLAPGVADAGQLAAAVLRQLVIPHDFPAPGTRVVLLGEEARTDGTWAAPVGVRYGLVTGPPVELDAGTRWSWWAVPMSWPAPYAGPPYLNVALWWGRSPHDEPVTCKQWGFARAEDEAELRLAVRRRVLAGLDQDVRRLEATAALARRRWSLLGSASEK